MAQPTSTTEEHMAKKVSQISALPPWRYVSEYILLDSSNDMTVDGSGGSPKVFSYSVPANYNLVISRIMLFMQTGGAMSVELFGNLAALGVGLEIKGDGILIATWKDNIDIYTECYDVDALSNVSSTAVDTTMSLRWTLPKDLNGPGLLCTDKFEAIVNDDLSSLTRLRIKIKGKLTPAGAY